jgi:hypothetical protein
MVLYEHICRHERVLLRIKFLKELSSRSTPPPCECGTKTEGSSGNVGLDVRASYSPYKYLCFPHLRTFLYADGPKYLTKVVREPNVTELPRSLYRDLSEMAQIGLHKNQLSLGAS